MKKQIRYNEHGAPIDRNPKWCDFIGEIFGQLGGWCYYLNGGLDRVNNDSRLEKLQYWFWGMAYAFRDIQCFMSLKGYKDDRLNYHETTIKI